jgi:hypothetical protein
VSDTYRWAFARGSIKMKIWGFAVCVVLLFAASPGYADDTNDDDLLVEDAGSCGPDCQADAIDNKQSSCDSEDGDSCASGNEESTTEDGKEKSIWDGLSPEEM